MDGTQLHGTVGVLQTLGSYEVEVGRKKKGETGRRPVIKV